MLPCYPKIMRTVPWVSCWRVWGHCCVTLGAKWDASCGFSRGWNSDGRKVPAGAGQSQREQAAAGASLEERSQKEQLDTPSAKVRWRIYIYTCVHMCVYMYACMYVLSVSCIASVHLRYTINTISSVLYICMYSMTILHVLALFIATIKYIHVTRTRHTYILYNIYICAHVKSHICIYIYMYIYDICHAHICVICIFYMLCISYIHIFVFNHVILDMHNMCPVRMLHICLYICIYLRLPGQTCVYVYICLHCAHYR